MATSSRVIRIRFDGTASGLNRAATEAEGALSGLDARTKALAAGVGALAAPALLVGATAVFAGIAAAGLASSAKVTSAFSELGQSVTRGLQDDASVLTATAVQVAGRLGQAFQSVRPILRNVFSGLQPQILALTDGLTGLIKNTLPGLAAASRAAGGAVAGFAELLRNVGTGVSDFFREIASAGPNAGGVFKSLGSILQSVLPVLGKLLAVASDFASGALPVIAAGVKAVATVLSSLLGILQPIAPLLGAITGGFLSLVAAVKLLGVARGAVAGLGAAMGRLGAQVGTVVATVTRSAAAGTAVANAFTKVGKALPFIGVALIGLGYAYDALKDKSSDAAQAVIDGSKTFSQAVDEQRAQLERQNGVLQVLTLGIRDSTSAEELQRRAVQDVTAALHDKEQTLSPLQRAQAEVAVTQSQWTDAVNKFGASSDQAKDAQKRYANAVAVAKDREEEATDATKDHTAALRDLTSEIEGTIDASLAYEEQLGKVKDAEHEAAVAVRQHGANSQQAKDAGFALQQEYEKLALAAAEKAKADNAAAGETQAATSATDAYRQKLSELAAQKNGPGRAAALGLIDRLTDEQLQAFNAANATSGFATEVRKLPSGRTVVITVDNGQAVPALQSVKDLLAGIRSKSVRVTVDRILTGDPSIGGGGFTPGGILARASGGPVVGGRTYLIGEEGPELLTIPGNGRGFVTPNNEIGQGLDSPLGGGGDVYVTVKIGETELRGMVQSEIRSSDRQVKRTVFAGAGAAVAP